MAKHRHALAMLALVSTLSVTAYAQQDIVTAARTAIAAIRAELDTLEATLPPPTPTETYTRPSPTGRDPKLLWSPEQQYVYSRMRADYEQGVSSLGGTWYELIRSNALGNRYGDMGLWATLMYQMTGDAMWVEEAWEKIALNLLAYTPTTAQLGTNVIREFGMDHVIMYDWLYPGLTEERRTQMRAKMDVMFTAAQTNQWMPPNAPISTIDSDQTVGTYFARAFYFLAAGDHHQPAVDYWLHPQTGGWAKTAMDRTTLRNAISTYIARAEGGEFIESGEYNQGTMKLMVMGYRGVAREHAADFTEIATWMNDAKFRTTYMLTPDLADPLQWGDDQKPRVIDNYKVVGLSMMFDDPVTNDVVHSFVERFGAVGSDTAEPAITAARGFFAFDPYASRVAKSTQPLAWWSRGQGILSARSSWDTNASLLLAHFPQLDPWGYVDHTVYYSGDLQFYRNGAWALTHPIAYAGRPNGGEGTNTMLLAGFGAPREFRGAATFQQTPDFTYVAGTVGGDVLPPVYWDPPPHWLHEFSRSVVWLKGEPDTLIVFDRVRAEDPRLLPKFTRYAAALQTQMNNAGSLKQGVIHMPVQPTIEANRVSWPGVVLDTFDSPSFSVVNESTWPPPPVQEPTSLAERKWHVRIVPALAPEFSTAMMTIRMGNATGTSVEAVEAGDVRGVLVHRVGQNDVLALFNAVAAPRTRPRSSANVHDPWNQGMLATARQRTTGYSVTWTAQASTIVLLPEAGGSVETVLVQGTGVKTLTR